MTANGDRPIVSGGKRRKTKRLPNFWATFFMAEGPGFEPGTTESESAVLPLNYPSIRLAFYQTDGHGANLRYTAVPLRIESTDCAGQSYFE